MSQSQQLSFAVELICFARGNARITSRLLFDSRWFLIQLALFWFCFFQMNKRDNEWDGELLISQKEPEKHWSVESQEALFKLSLTNTQRAPLKPPSQRSARGSVWNWAAWWWEVCESYSVPRHKFSSDFTSPYCLPPRFTLWWPLGGQRVSISCQILQTLEFRRLTWPLALHMPGCSS